MFVPRTISRKPNSRSSLPSLAAVQRSDAKVEAASSAPEQGPLTRRFDAAPPIYPHSEPQGAESGEYQTVEWAPMQRHANKGEHICIICGRHGEYICDQTGHRVCSHECEAVDIYKSQHSAYTSVVIPAGASSSSAPSHLTLASVGFPQRAHSSNRIFSNITCYNDAPHIAALSAEAASDLRNTHQVRVQGKRIPTMVSSFDDCGLQPKLLLNLLERGYHEPTPIQMQSIPAGLCGRDMLISAETGAGKTAGFLVPIVTHVYGLSQVYNKSMGSADDMQGPFALIITPTRELAMQIENDVKGMIKGLPNMLTALLVGGQAMANQVHRLRRNIQIAIGTPGRITDILAKHPEFSFSNVFCLVVDEVDMMFSMGFSKQVRRILDVLPEPPNGRQTVMCSATVSDAVQKLVLKFMESPIRIQLGVMEETSTPPTNLEKSFPSSEKTDTFVPASSVKQTVMWVENESKKKQLFSLLKDPKYFRPPILVFVESRIGADLLSAAIESKCPDIKAISIHGDKPQEERTAALQLVLNGVVPVVVATGLWARGLNLSVATVINFDMAPSIEEYVHRVGRANAEAATKAAIGIRNGPRLGGMAWAITFINNDHRFLLPEFANMLHGLGFGQVTPLPQQLKQLVTQNAPLQKVTASPEAGLSAKRKGSIGPRGRSQPDKRSRRA